MPVARNILVVEDDAAQREILTESLQMNGEFSVTAVATLAQADVCLKEPGVEFDAVVLDLWLADGNGCDWCTQLRREGRNMPIIIVTGACEEEDVINGLDSGANDYMTKPFSMVELAARLRAQLRLFENSDDATFTIGHHAFHPAAKQLRDRVRNRRVHLTAKETAILKFLYRAKSQTVPRPVLLANVWGYNAGVTTHTLETHVYRLRQKLELDPADCRLLLTETGGYRLNPGVSA